MKKKIGESRTIHLDAYELVTKLESDAGDYDEKLYKYIKSCLKQNEELSQTYNYCPVCHKQLHNNYCGNCNMVVYYTNHLEALPQEKIRSYHYSDGETSTIDTNENFDHIVERKLNKLITQCQNCNILTRELEDEIRNYRAGETVSHDDKKLSFSFIVDKKHGQFYIYKKFPEHITVRFYSSLSQF